MRAVVDRVLPEVDAGRVAVKRVVGDAMTVTAHAFTDGHADASTSRSIGIRTAPTTSKMKEPLIRASGSSPF